MVFFAESMVKSFAKNVKEGPLRNLTECIRNKWNKSQMWLRGFEQATNNHHCGHAFSIGKYLKNVQEFCALQNQ